MLQFMWCLFRPTSLKLGPWSERDPLRSKASFSEPCLFDAFFTIRGSFKKSPPKKVAMGQNQGDPILGYHFRTYFSGWIGMFPEGTGFWTHGQVGIGARFEAVVFLTNLATLRFLQVGRNTVHGCEIHLIHPQYVWGVKPK